MLLHVFALAQGAPRFDDGILNTVVVTAVATAVVLVFWASRPSVMARYSSSPRPAGDDPDAEKESA
jgi:hypothetical protein